MAELKRTYNIPLRKDFSRVPPYKRAKRAIMAVRVFLARHMKGDVKLGRRLNLFLWGRGVRNPPHHICVDALRDDKNIVKAELTGFAYEEKKVVQQEKGKIKETLDLLTGKKEETVENKEEKVEKKNETKEEQLVVKKEEDQERSTKEETQTKQRLPGPRKLNGLSGEPKAPRTTTAKKNEMGD